MSDEDLVAILFWALGLMTIVFSAWMTWLISEKIVEVLGL